MSDETVKETIVLPEDLGQLTGLQGINERLRAGTCRLDWSRVRTVGDGLSELLSGLDLSDHADLLGLGTVPDHLAEVIEQTMSGKPTVDSGKGEGKPVLKTPSAVELRDELVEMVGRDLLGPAGGPEEEVGEPNVRDRYIVGMLAPKKALLIPEEFEETGVESGTDSEDGTPEQQMPIVPNMFPSSMGLTFSVAGKDTRLRITARWGHYDRQRSETLVDKAGKPEMVWKRSQVQGTLPELSLAPGNIERWVPSGDHPDVYVEGVARRYDDDFVVTIFLVNGQVEPERSRDKAWIFQPEIIIDSPDGKPVFRKRPLEVDQEGLDPVTASEKDAMEMLYRKRVEFAVGHGVAVHAEVSGEDTTRAVRLETRVMPVGEVHAQQPPTVKDFPKLKGLELDMKALAETPREKLSQKLRALPEAYADWIKRCKKRIESGEDGLGVHKKAGKAAIERCEQALERIRDGLSVIASNDQAAEAFRFANRAMWQQRVRSVYAEKRRRGFKVTEEEIDTPENRTWYAFQLAFILLNLPGITNLEHKDRTHPSQATADLLWFPTGGGKTEAYLGLAAYTMGLRRLQGMVAGYSGAAGLAVLMRYTLRLLTLQQFQRAATLICACEKIRRAALKEGDERWGREPFRIGLWVGRRTTPNSTEQSEEAVKQSHGMYQQGSLFGGVGTPAQLKHCPWCGTEIKPGKDLDVKPYKRNVGRTLTYCGDKSGACLFSKKQAKDEGIPVVVVDEEIYRRLPTMVIATVDKFAQLPWNGATQMLFGRVNGYCPRHGYRSPEIKDTDSHRKEGEVPAVKTEPAPPLRPPDLIIQDELHLISGPLGTMTGLYETAIDELCTWDIGGKRVRPKVIASTATIRRASEQVHNLFSRRVSIFPPHGIDVEDSFFSLQRGLDVAPGRRYLGVCAPGRRLKAVQVRVYVAFLAAAQVLYERHGMEVDPWMTMVGYFNSIRELAGGRRLIDDSVRFRLRDTDKRGLARRESPVLEELTSRKASTEIPDILDRLEIPFDPEAEKRRKQKTKAGEYGGPKPLDVVLATNMISVGVDVRRLGLMVVMGQPKTTAEYIQATSRVGRAAPGLVCTVFNWARPRDLSHYEKFEHYHATFYKHVEALSVTPFAPRAIDRGLTALLVSLIRLSEDTYNANEQAQVIEAGHPLIRRAIERIVERAKTISESQAIADEVQKRLKARLDRWLSEAGRSDIGSRLGYRDKRDNVTRGLLKPAGSKRWDDFTCLNSLRDVEPSVGLILDDSGFDDAFQEGGGS